MMNAALDFVTLPEAFVAALRPRLRHVLEQLSRRWTTGRLDLTIGNLARIRVQGTRPGPSAILHLHQPSLLRRLAFGGAIGFAEAYVAGQWDSPDLGGLLEGIARNFAGTKFAQGAATLRLWGMFQHWRRRNSLSGARRNIFAHYDLGNAFFSHWLDSSMTYSAAIFESAHTSLASAQRRKYVALAERIGLLGGHHVLEIGCGWGGFAAFAAGEIGARVTALTLSPAQHAFVSKRMQRAGLSQKVDVVLMDYRDITGRYDRVVSIEMIEAVGERYWSAYFRKLAEVLTPGGVAGIQSITIDNARFAKYRKQPDFIQRYIFPGGMLPCERRLAEEAANAGLAWNSIFRFGDHYARTLESWAENFAASWNDIAKLGFDDRFRRLWTYYLAYCKAGFRSGQIDVIQLTLHKI
jgi:cyclopropane-fatty-acyl-phospholipid synthase